MRALVTGAAGFVARHLVAHLAEAGDEVRGLVRPGQLGEAPAALGEVFAADVRDAGAVAAALARARPEAVYHLAGLADVGQAWGRRREVFEVNVLGAHSLLEAARALDPRPRVLLVGSAYEYGRPASDEPLVETAPLLPTSPYGASKAAQELLGLQYALGEGVPVVLVRAFTHAGPGQAPGFVLADWARGVAAIERGDAEPRLSVGNLDAARDFSDVRDVVRAYRLLVERGRPGEAYNVCSGEARPLRQVMAELRRLARVPFTVTEDPSRRPGDVRILVGSRARIKRDTGWEPSVPFARTLADVLDDWRARAD